MNKKLYQPLRYKIIAYVLLYTIYTKYIIIDVLLHH